MLVLGHSLHGSDTLLMPVMGREGGGGGGAGGFAALAK